MKKFVAPAFVFGAIALASIIWAGTASAGNGFSKQEQIQKLAQKLGVEESKVDEAFVQVREERQAEMQEKHEEKLSQAVKDGVLTEDQKSQLAEKQNAHQAEMQNLRQTHKEEMQKWMDEQGIDESKLRTYMGGGGKHGRMRQGQIED